MLLAPLLLLLPSAVQDPALPPQEGPPPKPQWTTSFSSFWIEPPHQSGYLSAILYADNGPLHLEAHWAYEDRDTFSIFAGKTIPIEGDLKGSFTPRLGLATGDSEGLIPAMALELGWEKLSFKTDVEYMIGSSNSTSDFLYSWSELDWAVTDRFTLGLVGQRTNVFDQELTVDRGLVFGVALAKMRLTAYVFNLDVDDPYVMVALEAGF